MKISRLSAGCVSGVINRGVVLAFICSAAVAYAGEPIPSPREDVMPIVSSAATLDSAGRGREVVLRSIVREPIMIMASTPAQSILDTSADDELVAATYPASNADMFNYNSDVRSEMERKHALRSQQLSSARYYRYKHSSVYGYPYRCSYYYNNCSPYYYPDGYWPQSSLQWSLGLGYMGSSHHNHGRWGYGVGVSQAYRYPYHH